MGAGMMGRTAVRPPAAALSNTRQSMIASQPSHAWTHNHTTAFLLYTTGYQLPTTAILEFPYITYTTRDFKVIIMSRGETGLSPLGSA